jgi:exonuclease SbcD
MSHPLRRFGVVKILHTSDWHVGRNIRGRSRADEHQAVLAEIAQVARDEAVDAVLVVGDLFDVAAPTAEAERIVYSALLELAATGATVVVLAGNHDSDRRLQAIEPLLDLGNVVTRPVFRRPDDGGVVELVSRDGTERAKLAVLPFLSQRYVVSATDLMGFDADEHGQAYDQRVRLLVGALTAGFGPDTINLVAAHLTVGGGVLGGGERSAHTVFEYEVGALAFPSSAQYVALGHLHRRQQVQGPGQIHYCGSPLQLDFGETSDIKCVVVVDVKVGLPAEVRDVWLRSGRRLRVLAGTLDDLRALAGTTGDDWLKLVVRDTPRVGLADDLRDLFPHAVDVVVERAEQAGRTSDRPSIAGRAPGDLFGDFLRERGEPDEQVLHLFAELLDELESSGVD